MKEGNGHTERLNLDTAEQFQGPKQPAGVVQGLQYLKGGRNRKQLMQVLLERTWMRGTGIRKFKHCEEVAYPLDLFLSWLQSNKAASLSLKDLQWFMSGGSNIRRCHILWLVSMQSPDARPLQSG